MSGRKYASNMPVTNEDEAAVQYSPKKRRGKGITTDKPETNTPPTIPEGRTWMEVVNDDNMKEASRLLAINFINDRVAYYYNIYMMITAYLQARNIPYKPSNEYTWKFYADGLYDAMLQRSRQQYDLTSGDNDNADEENEEKKQ